MERCDSFATIIELELSLTNFTARYNHRRVLIDTENLITAISRQRRIALRA